MLLIGLLIWLLGVCMVVTQLEFLRYRDGTVFPSELVLLGVLLWPLGLFLLTLFVFAGDREGASDGDEETA